MIEEATKFVGACYGRKTQESISKVRYHKWAKRTSSKKITKTPRFKSLPPTSESFAENIKRAHIQTSIWKAAMKQDPPRLDPTDFGWSKDEVTKSLSPVTTPTNTATLPTKVLQMIRCGCSTDLSCSISKCGCVTAQLPCIVFCTCHSEEKCSNKWTHHLNNNMDFDDIDDNEDEEL